MKHFSVAPLLFALAAPLFAAEISVTALFGGKAVVVVNGGKPRMLSVGESTPEGVKLLAASSDGALVEYRGQKQRLGLGEGTRVASAAPASRGAQVRLKAGPGGHFYADGSINGVAIRFLVDTGATSVALPAADARRAGINYKAGKLGRSMTANGPVYVYRVKLDNVRIGDITLNNVDASVHDGGLGIALLGMSFLNRTQMTRDGDTLTLIRRF